jgi:adenosyl cobinamide kinase/adenosyl cobinamide phosphate guanylyltransferase
MLTIVNENNLVGTQLTGMSISGPTEWSVSGIGKGLHHYIIYLKRNDNDWEREIKLHRKHSPNQTGKQYKLECGTEHMHLYKTSFLTIDIFKNYLEYFI